MALILGLAGFAGVGKDTVAQYLVERYGFQVFAFSDVLYEEVAAAYGLESEDLLRDRETKEVAHPALALEHCRDDRFVAQASMLLEGVKWSYIPTSPLSPRQVLQWWGTEYRRAQDPDYWLKKNDEWLQQVHDRAPYPEHRPQHFVNTTCRFENEQRWIHDRGGNVWHIRREGYGPINAHVSDQPLPVLHGERELYNNDTIERLYQGVDLLMSTAARFVRMEPLRPMAATEEEALAHADTPTID